MHDISPGLSNMTDLQPATAVVTAFLTPPQFRSLFAVCNRQVVASRAARLFWHVRC